MVEVTIHFGRADARVESEHIGQVHFVNLWATQNAPPVACGFFVSIATAARR